MDLYEFNYFSKDERADLIWDLGSLIAIRYDGGYSVVLYHMGEFFAEVKYSAQHNHIVSVRGFKSKTYLEPYLEMVDLSELIKE
ncbi:hypothetical protein CLV24_14416 [Pontibacter ummariensis]|uniref:Uncharacterized protein n=1 Tax=Pontibacter ummariensis TaxID=1610492 RepID=A0A239LME9_9BACT|nr:hypothetical protein [Pontibacter ummariensis]PRY02947.1 hypothetical protein CLV24_14416 [Pontibacter ummariensis]SNT31661.1 hypothetical protein SAMN06296052_14516 [Pontibacter ummariensis]